MRIAIGVGLWEVVLLCDIVGVRWYLLLLFYCFMLVVTLHACKSRFILIIPFPLTAPIVGVRWYLLLLFYCFMLVVTLHASCQC